MFIDEQTRTVQKHILDILHEHTGNDGGQLHSGEVKRFRNNPHGAELSNFFYCRELRLRSWYSRAVQLDEEQMQSIWSAIVARCGVVELAAPDDLGPATHISALVQYVYLNTHCDIKKAR